jgi:sec-independent protein translocase protein TatC
MTLVDHLRELRTRLMWSFLAILVGAVVGWIEYPRLFDFLERPFLDAVKRLHKQGTSNVQLTINGVADAFNLQIQISLAAGLVLSSPIWMYQIFRFITPGLHHRERRWGAMFVTASLPLFLGGVIAAYFVLPRVLDALLGFTPENVSNFITVDKYMGFLVQLMIVFGIGCIAPVLIVVLNQVGLLSARRFASWWRWTLFGTLVFAAVATPTGDPVSMLVFAAPLLLLMVVAFVICWNTDRRRAKHDRETGFAGLSDDEPSPLGLTPIDDEPADVHGRND